MRRAESHPWRPVATSSQQERASRLAVRIAGALKELPAAALTKKWLPVSVAEGDAGMALMCGYVGACVGDPSWATSAHRYLQSAATWAAREGPVLPGLFDGLAGLGFVASLLSREGSRYQRLLMSIDDALRAYLNEAGEKYGARSRCRDFDAEGGLSGVGMYLIQRADRPSGLTDVTRLAERLIGSALDRATPPPWAKIGDAVRGPFRTQFPHGYVDCGLAHGVPGPLAYLARSRALGAPAEGLDEALRHIVTWLNSHQRDDAYGPQWPVGVPLDVSGRVANGPGGADELASDAWCYGTPGVARALWLAGAAMGDSATCELAADAMRAVYPRLADTEHALAPGLCHGLAGLLQITLRFHHDTGDEEFAHHARALLDRLLGLYESDNTYGYRNNHPSDPDNPGFVDGAAGVVTTLLAASTDVAPEWDQVLLIA